MGKKNEVVTVSENKVAVSENKVDSFIAQAIEKNLPVETMERLFVLHKEVKAEMAREDFVRALASFQGYCPVIAKTKKVMNKDGRTLRYMYAPMDSVIEQIKGPLADNGLSYTWNSSRQDEHIKVICKLTHTSGHSEQSEFDIPIVKSDFMTSPQSYATAQSYAKRYTLLNVLGISTADEDTDSTDTGKNGDVKDPRAKITFLLRQAGYKGLYSKDQFNEAVMKSTKLELKEENFQDIIERLEILIQEQGL